MKDFELLFGNTENLCASKRNKILVTRQANILRPRSQNLIERVVGDDRLELPTPSV